MSDTRMRLRQADEDAIDYVEALLRENGLPTCDVASKAECFYIGYDGGERVGVGGVELFDSCGLLRSVAVESPVRGNGHGTALCEGLEAKASADGVERLYLLTTTATEFFGARGYVEVDRTAVPRAVQQTTEFDELCPATATCMEKSL